MSNKWVLVQYRSGARTGAGRMTKSHYRERPRPLGTSAPEHDKATPPHASDVALPRGELPRPALVR